MKLQEALERAGGNIRLGAAVCYLYCGPADGVDLDALDDASFRFASRMLERYEAFSEKPGPDRAYNRRMERQYRKIVEGYVPFREREVLSVCKSINKDVTIIIVEGDEVGEFWDEGESTDASGGFRKLKVDGDHRAG